MILFWSHYRANIFFRMPESHRKTPLRRNRRLSGPQTAFQRCSRKLCSHFPEASEDVYLWGGDQISCFILLWLNSEKPADRQMAAWKTGTFKKKTPCKRTFCAGAQCRRACLLGRGSHRKSDVWCPSDAVLYALTGRRAASIVFETSSAEKGGHFILRQCMWDFSGWSDLSAIKWRNRLTFALCRKRIPF